MISHAFVRTTIVLLTPAGLWAADLTATERRGEQIYVHGIGQEGREVSAVLRLGGAVVSGALMNCASCHGYDGRGRPESGVTPPSVRWDDLTRPYDVAAPTGRRHSGYDEALLRRAITQGIDPAGNTLGDVMPTYRLTEQEARDLIAYVKRIGAPDPGLSDSTITVGVFLPPAGDYAGAIRAALAAYFEEMNRAGGIYGRCIDAKFAYAPALSPAVAQSLRRFIEETQPFLLLDSYLAGAEREAASTVEEIGIPLIGGLTLYPRLDFPLNRYVFYLYGGVAEEAETLASYAERNGAGPSTIVFSGEENQDVARAVRSRAGRDNWTLLNANDALASLQRINPSNLLLLCPPDIAQRVIDGVKLTRRFLIPGSLASASLLGRRSSAELSMILAFSAAPSGHSAQAMTYYRNLAAAHQLPAAHLAAQVSAMAGAKVMQEALIHAGREVSREKLIDSLESLYELQTGLTSPVSFGPNRRVGIQQPTLATVDPKTGEIHPLLK